MVSVWLVAALAQELPWDKLEDPARWELVTTRLTDVGEVVVSYQNLDGQDCAQGSLRTEVPMERLLAVVNDVNGAEDWSEQGLADSRVLDVRDGHLDFYQVMDVPAWTMASDRWWLLRAFAVPGRIERFRWHRLDAATAYPEVYADVNARFAGVIEMPVNWGEWAFVPEEGGVHAHYRVCTLLGGSLPRWIGRMAMRKSLPDNLVDLVREAQGALTAP